MKKNKESHEKCNRFLNTVSMVLMWALLVLAAITLIWIIICGILWGCNKIPEEKDACLLFQLPKLIAFFGGCISLWLVSFQLKKQNDVETVRQLGYLRELLNTGDKKKIHFYLLNSHKCGKRGDNDQMALLGDIEADDKYVKSPHHEKLEKEDKVRHSNVELFDYLGVLELGSIMLERGLISEDEFENQFLYRIENVYRSSLRDDICSPQSKKYYKYMIQHFKRIESNRNH